MTDPAKPSGGTAPDPAPARTGKRKRPWAALATFLTALAAALSILMFFTDSRSWADLVGRRNSGAAEPARRDVPPQQAGVDTGRTVETAPGDDVSNGASDRSTVPPTVLTEALDEGERTYPIEARVESLRAENDQTLLTLAMINRSEEPLRYLHAVRSEVRSQNASDRFDLLASDGSARSAQAQRGLIATPDGAHEVFCLALPPETAAHMTLVFPSSPTASMTLVHTSDPDLIRYRTCGGTTIALRDFRIDIPQTP